MKLALSFSGQGEIVWTAAQTRTSGDNWREKRSEDVIWTRGDGSQQFVFGIRVPVACKGSWMPRTNEVLGCSQTEICKIFLHCLSQGRPVRALYDA